MIQRIDFLKGFGLFRDFNGGNSSRVPPFRRYNLIYGWNYSGKTTLSRVFQSLEKKSLPEGYSAARFKITLDDGTTISSDDLSSSPAVRVFNRDFVDSNFQQENAAPAVFILGEKNAALKARLAQLYRRSTRLEGLASKFDAEREAIERDISKLATNAATSCGTLLGVRNFRRPDLMRRVEEVKNDPSAFILTTEEVDGKLSTLRTGQDYAPLTEIEPPSLDVAALASEVNNLLAQTASNRAIMEIAQDPELEAWVRAGRKLHEKRTTCGFCGQNLTAARLQALQDHFSEAYDRLLTELDALVEKVANWSPSVNLSDEARILPELRQQFVSARTRLAEWEIWAETTRQSLVEALRKKQRAVETSSIWSGDISRALDLPTLLAELNAVIDRHNQTVGALDKAKEEARLALERHFAARYFVDHQIREKKETVWLLKEKIKRAASVNEHVNGKIGQLEARISESSIGANRLNELLNYLLSGCNIQVESSGDGEFRFLRDGQPATNLSDGEKTAVTFAYFLIHLEEEGSPPEETIVFVDDPISSLDSNHVYAVFALITKRLSCCRQLFVSTHNSHFFNLFKGQWLGQRGGDHEDSRAYWIFRELGDDGLNHARIIDLPLLLRRYKSEYEFVFSRLYQFASSPSPSQHEAYTAPNLLRKFLEAYLGFRKPAVRTWHKKLDLLFDTAEQGHEIRRFADDASHLQNLEQSLQQPNFVPSSQRCVCAVLDALKDKDPEHFDSLVAIAEERSDV